MTDAEVARRLDLTSSRYSKYVLDQREPDYGTLLRLCAVLACSPTDLLVGPIARPTPADVRAARCASALALLDDGTADTLVAMVEAAARSAQKA